MRVNIYAEEMTTRVKPEHFLMTLKAFLNAKQSTQYDVAEVYADALDYTDGDFKWAEVNGLIQRRWPKGLARVKQEAWRIKADRDDRAAGRGRYAALATKADG